MDRTDKRKFLVIEKSKNPRCFNKATLLVEYQSNERAWIKKILTNGWKTLIKKIKKQDKGI